MVATDVIDIRTKGFTDIKNITEQASEIIRRNNWKNGIVCFFAVGSTAGISTVEFEPGLQKDIPEILEKYIPYNYPYKHHNTWHDDNGAAHVRATLIGSSLSVPLIDGSMTLGTWQQIILIDFDTTSRSRKVVVQFVGE